MAHQVCSLASCLLCGTCTAAALHKAFVEAQNKMPGEHPDNNAGTTAITCWLEHG